ncbi:unnamed protein product [Adineta steineri]|uniref:Uncharacterized protein n=2 Tax=Adineta steineri TaxID=433720 RepID=A0A818IWL7_9BILA|nr:unnamed protein product [Adineta steineri]
MYLANIQIFSFILFFYEISSKSISFSYRTCLPNINLIHIEHIHPLNSQHFQLITKDFHLNIIYTYKTDQYNFKFGSLNPSLSNLSNFDYQFQSAIDYYHQIDTWNYVNITFDDNLSRIFISFNSDETRLIPLIDYPLIFQNKTIETKLNVQILVDEQDKNVTCLLPYNGFQTNKNSYCSTDIKTCEHRLCTPLNSAEQYCPLFKIFDCHPFTDLQCGLKTIPVRCSYNHCQNQGICQVDILKNTSQCICPSGIAGDQCQYSIDECQSNPCPFQSKCIDLPNGYTCICDPGWTGIDCSEDINECKTIQPCKAARSCTNLPGSYKCDCLESFTGQNCEMTLDPCLSQPCLNNATKCHLILDRDNVLYHCTCQSGFTGSNCETNINDCEGIICPKNNTQCIDGINSFHCECKSNFKRNWDGECVEQNPCDSSPCHQNATCYNLNGGQYRCMCPPTYTGIRCDEDIDECTVFPFICRNGGTCVNEIGSYRCYCTEGWFGLTCAKAIDYCLSQPCNRNGTCINKINGFECRCLSPYTGNVCQYDIDECLIEPCANNGTCYNYVGGFHCRCPPGYFGFHCEYPPSECQRLQQASLSVKCTDSHLCVVNDTEKLRQINQLTTNTCRTERDRILDNYFGCISEQKMNYCHCPSNIFPCADNYTETIGRSLLSKSSCPCRNGGSCHWINSTDYRCYCPPGLTGQNCLVQIDYCLSQPCYNNGTCLSQLNTFTCRCQSNYKGIYCQTLIDSCENNPCLNNGICRRNNRTKYQCQCPSNYTGRHCEIYQTPCLSQPCRNNGKCLNLNHTFECQCSLNYQGKFCEHSVDLCQTKSNKSLCLNNGLCLITNHLIQCLCLPGFTGLFCEININECYTNPCSSHGECIDLVNGYQCHCNTGWLGYNCENKQNEISKSFIYHTSLSSTFHLRSSSINISKSLPYRHSSLPMRIQYEFRTTLKQISLISIGKRFKQELNDNRILTNLDNKTLLSTFIDYNEKWFMISIEIFHLWIDVKIGKNSLSQRFYISNSSLANLINNQVIFGFNNYSGCVRNIEITYSQVYSILLTDQLVETNENRTLGCERYCINILLFDSVHEDLPYLISLDLSLPYAVETNACQHSTCQKNEICQDHWFYHICQCQRPFFGEHCDQIAPIISFNERSLANISLSSPISNISLFFNTLQSNGTLFELGSSIKQSRSTRDLTSHNQTSSKIIGALIDGHFRLIIIDGGPKHQEYELRSEQRLNDGRPHNIQLDLENSRLLIDEIYNETLTNTNTKLLPNQVELLGDGSLNGWLQDIRINDQLISFDQTNKSTQNFNLTVLNMKQQENNPCYPNNPCLNQGICFVTNLQDYLCQCETNWFGRNCSEPNICNHNNTSLCPDGFICKVTDENQECLATATFEGNSSSLIASLYHNSISKISNELSFRLRARSQHTHLLTIKNLYTSNYFSLYLHDENLIYRDSILTTDLIIELNNETFDEWTTFHLHWSDFSTLTVNYLYTYTVNLSLKSLLTSNSQTQIFIGNGFRGCLEYVLVGENLYIPFYNNIIYENDTRTNKFFTEQIENIQINNCTFNHICENMNCQNGQCASDFDQGKCICNHGWNGKLCQININECEQGNNCSKENSICVDHLDGYYTCKCNQGFTGYYCETNIDECASSPCNNNGTCIDQINSYTCQCTSEYINSHCSLSINNTCFGRLNRCKNNGTCILKSAHLYVDNPKSECQCQNGYDGEWCENDLCLKLHCQNNSTCQRLSNGQAKCLCSQQWYGNECQYDINECEINQTNICLNNGTCVNYPGDYECQCHENYLGKNCEKKHICLEQTPCLNHGQCKTDGEHYYCECLTNFTGLNCEFLTCESLPCQHNGTCMPDIDEGFLCNCTGTGYEDDRCSTEIDECVSSPCRNNGTCINQIDGYICACPKNFLGHSCESKEKLFSSLNFSYHYVIWPGIAIFLLMIIILLTVVMGRIRKNRRLRGTYRPAINENGQSSRMEFSMILKPPPEERLI